MKTLVNRSLALLLTLALMFTMTPFTTLAEATENEDGMDEIMDILETNEDETVSADPGEAVLDGTEEAISTEDYSEEDQPIVEESEEAAIADEQTGTSDQPDTPEEEMFPDDPDDPGVEDDWADWYTEDQPEEESEESGDDWPKTDDAITEDEEGDHSQPLTLEEEIAQLYDGSYIKYAIEQAGHAYVTTKGTATKVYETSALEDGEVICAITEKGVILLAFEYAERWNNRSVLVWFLNDAFEAVSGYVREADLEQEIMGDADAAAWMNVLPAAYISTTAGQFPVFVAPIVLPETPEEDVAETPASDTEYPEESGEEEIDDPVIPDEQPEETEVPDIPADQPEEEADPDDPEVAVGTFLFVTTKTRAFSDMDDTLRDDANGDLYMGVFVKDAVVQVDAVRMDSTGRLWYQVAFLYGDDFVDGAMKWTEIGLAYVLQEETALTDAEDLTVTDIALPETPKASGRRMLMKAAGTTPMNGFTLKSINAPIPPLYAGQTGVYGSSGHDSDYKQIASLPGKGAIYATPHYLDGYTVYCLEHNLPGPGEGSGSSQQPKGPYVIVDIDTYMNTPGSSRVIYSDQTMHAIAWVLRHTYPFMVLDRNDSDNETWSRVAGQFAIRQVIREMEGAQYVRDYWNMDNFYVASGQAPAVYLEYARWLAANGIARGNITGYISVANKSISKVGNNYVGNATLYTDADLIRIPKGEVTITGNTLGGDSSYYYLNSGDTITVTSSTNGFSITAESVNSDAEEASFLVGIPSASIQKVLIPQYGSPYKMQSATLYFEQEIQYGNLTVTKLRSGTQQKLAGAKLQLYDSSKKAYGDPVTTDAGGQAKWTNLPYGTYYVGEIGAPAGYQVNVEQVQVTINGNNTAIFNNSPIIGSVSFVKVQRGTEIPLVGAQYELVTKSGSTYKRAVSAVDGSELPVLTTDANGKATWSNVVEYGTYYVHEVKAPEGFLLDNTYHAVSVTQHNKIVSADVEDLIITAKIKIAKTDGLTKKPLSGVEFTITRLSGPAALNGAGVGEVVAVITTDANGYAETDWLDWGRFKVEETKVPAGYTDSHYSTELEAYEDGKTYTIGVENEPAKGWIRLKKTDRLNGNPVSGVQFDIFYNDQYGEGLAATMVTDENGVAMSEPIRKGRYIVKEHGETAGYVFEEVTLNCTVKSDEITDLSATNQPVQVRLKLYKRDVDEYAGDPVIDPATRGDGVLTGAVFQVLASENITDGQGNTVFEKGAVVVESLKTVGKDASVTTEELWPGMYEIIELTPPTGYQPTDKHTIVDASSAAQQSKEAVITYEDVVCNEILYGCYAFVKFTGDNEIHDDAGLIETPEPAAVFHVYLKQAGSFDAARSFERDTITTDEYGKAQTKLLPYGIYTVQQIKGKEGYAIKAPFDIFIRGTENPENPPSMILNNEAIRYRLKFIKVDAETGKTITLANTAFKLKDANGEYVIQTVRYPRTQVIDTFKTDADGTVTLPETVRYGMYFIEEFQAPEGYLIQTEELAVFVGDENMNQPGEAYLLEFEIDNTPVKGQIRLEKTGLQLTGFKEKKDRYGNTVMQPIYEEKRLAGAVFEVHAAETITGKDGTVWYEQDALVNTITTTADGPDVSALLPLGRYYLVEVSAPDGYSFDDRHYETDLIYVDDHTPLVKPMVTAGNDYLPAEISLTKEKEVLQIVQEGDAVRQITTTVPGEGFTFGLYNDTDIHYESGTLMADSLVAVGVTDADGKLTFSGNFPHGRYFIKELSAPAGWKINTERFTVTLDPAAADEDHVIRVTLPEAVHDELIWYPVTLTKLDITGEKTLPGALIEVSNDKGEVIYRAYTDKNGQIPNIPVTPGSYTFREILAPSGYALNEAVMSFTVDVDGGITGDTTIRDDYTRVLLQKQDENGLPLAGVEFALTKSNGTVLMRKTSDADGRIVFEKIPYGEYTITETKALAGYQRHDVSIRLTVDGTFVNSDAPMETIINYPIIVKLKKVDQDGKPLPGAEYALVNEYGEQMMTAVSDVDGMLTFYKVPYGKYTVKELYAPDGYLLNKDTPEIVINDSWQNSDAPVLTLTNHLKRLRYIKVDTSGKHLPGVEFSLINASNGEVAEVVTSNEKGEFIFTKFDYGFWLIRETKTPDSYCQMKDITFSVDASWMEPAPFTCVNIPNHYEFVKTDKEGNPMVGVTFTLEDQEGNILRDLVSGEGGIVHVDDLTPDTYIIREMETLEGFTVSGETIEVVIDEHYIVPDEMYVLVNYPDIQTGVNFEITPWMYAGGAAMLAGLILLLAALFRRLRK